MPDLETIQRAIRERLSEVGALIEALRIESEQLRKMLESTGARVGEPAARARGAARGKQSGGSAPATGSRGRPRGVGGSRAQQTLEWIAATPGITAAELAKAMGIKRNYLYRVLPALEKDGKITKQGKGYHPVSLSQTPAPS